MRLPLFYDVGMRCGGIRIPLYCYWDIKHTPHFLMTGSTGSGKTYASMLVLARISLHLPDAQATVLDFKQEDFRFADSIPRYYKGLSAIDGFHVFYRRFEERLNQQDTKRNRLIVYADEWPSMLNVMDKKEADDAKKKLATMLMLGRSLNVHVIVGAQRPDAQYFNAARDNFSAIVALGNLSTEGKDMLFHDYKSGMEPVTRCGEGYMLTDGHTLTRIQVPLIGDMPKIRRAICDLITR